MKVKSAVLIQSDDMAMGVDDGSLPVPAGTPGRVIKDGAERSLVVEFTYGPYKVIYDCMPEELTFDDVVWDDKPQDVVVDPIANT